MVLTIAEFDRIAGSDACKALHDRSQPLVAEPWENVFLGHVPVTWDSVGTDSLEEADDWKEVDIVGTMSEAEALTALRAVFGPLAEIDSEATSLASDYDRKPRCECGCGPVWHSEYGLVDVVECLVEA